MRAGAILASDEYAADVRMLENRYTGSGVHAVPAVIVNDHYLIEGGQTPVLSAAELAEIGYSLAIFPATGFLAMGAALKGVYGHIRREGSSTGLETPLDDFKEFSKLMGFERVWEFERRWADTS